MHAVLLIVIPLVGALVGFFLKTGPSAKRWAMGVGILTLAVSVVGLTLPQSSDHLRFDAPWLSMLGSRFTVALDGMGQILCLLTAVSFPIIILATWRNQYSRPASFYALLMLSQAGLMGVFVAMDALLFYFFWELALLPVYFLASLWGGEKRVQAAFKFFIYTFVGSLLMLVVIIYLYFQTADHSFSIKSFYALRNVITPANQSWLFWMMFVAFAIKMPIFPFHTWQADVYEQSAAPVTMVMSVVMVKMGLLGLIRWLAPVLPIGTWAWGDTVSVLCIIGMIYASLIALRQNDLKRLVAYSSIAHMGLMCLAVFATTAIGLQGVMIQLFSHGINILGLWIVVDLIERQFHTRKISELGGLAQQAPVLATGLVIVVLANIALPLTNAFVGELLMFTGVYTSVATVYSVAFTVCAALSIILSAVYMLAMVQKVFYGPTNQLTAKATDIRFNEQFVLAVIILLIVVMGIYPKPVFDMTRLTVDTILTKMNFKL